MSKSESPSNYHCYAYHEVLWKSMVCHFSIPKSIISDNGGQFDSSHYREWCTKLGIKYKYSFPGHLKQVKATNKTLMEIQKKKLTDQKGRWAEELPGVSWMYRTTIRTPTGETPFALTYGSEAILPVEVGVPSTEWIALT